MQALGDNVESSATAGLHPQSVRRAAMTAKRRTGARSRISLALAGHVLPFGTRMSMLPSAIIDEANATERTAGSIHGPTVSAPAEAAALDAPACYP